MRRTSPKTPLRLLALVMLALALYAPADAQGPETSRVLAVYGRVDTEEGAEALLELRDLAQELGPRVVGLPSASTDEREAFLVASVLLADHTVALPEPRPDPLTLLEQARSVVDASVRPDYASWADFSYASQLVGAGRFAEAEAVLGESLAGPAPGSSNEMAILHLYAEVLRGQTRWEEARLALDALELRLVDVEEEAREGQLDTATARAQREVWWARAHGSRGQLEQRLGRLDLAAEAHRREGEHAQRSGDPFTRAVHLINRCDWGLVTEDYAYVERTLAELDPASFDGALRSDQRALIELYRGMAQAESEREDPALEQRSVATLTGALENEGLPYRERLVAQRALADLALRSGAFAEARERIAVLRAALATEAGLQHENERVFLAMLEARLALDEGADSELLAECLEALQGRWAELLEQWSRTPASPGGVGFLHHSDRRELLSTLVQLHLRVHGPERGPALALERVLEAEARGTLARRLGLARAELARVRDELLKDDHGVLVYLPSRERSHVFGLDQESVWHVELPREGEVLDDVIELLAELRFNPARLRGREARRSQAADLERQSGRVSAVLLPPEAEERVRSWKRVTLRGTQLVGQLPPATLRLADGSLLGERLALDVVPSLTVALHLAERARAARVSRTAAGPDLALLATLDPGAAALERWSGLASRTLTADDTRALTAPFEGRARTLLGPAVTRARLFEAPLHGVPVVHFLVHGATLSDRERQAALLLSGDEQAVELLTCEDVEASLELSGLVLLSACATARGPARAGDDNLAHLGGAFLVAGAQAVVLAQAPVELGPTLQLMRTVHERVAAGDAPAEALRTARARLAERAEDPLARYVATQFEVLGLGQEPLF